MDVSDEFLTIQDYEQITHQFLLTIQTVDSDNLWTLDGFSQAYDIMDQFDINSSSDLELCRKPASMQQVIWLQKHYRPFFGGTSRAAKRPLPRILVIKPLDQRKLCQYTMKKGVASLR